MDAGRAPFRFLPLLRATHPLMHFAERVAMVATLCYASDTVWAPWNSVMLPCFPEELHNWARLGLSVGCGSTRHRGEAISCTVGPSSTARKPRWGPTLMCVAKLYYFIPLLPLSPPSPPVTPYIPPLSKFLAGPAVTHYTLCLSYLRLPVSYLRVRLSCFLHVVQMSYG